MSVETVSQSSSKILEKDPLNSNQKSEKWQVLLDLIFLEALASFNHNKSSSDQFHFTVATTFARPWPDPDDLTTETSFDRLLQLDQQNALERITQIARNLLEVETPHILAIEHKTVLNPTLPEITVKNLKSRFEDFLSPYIVTTQFSEKEILWIDKQINALRRPDKLLSFINIQDFSFYIAHMLSLARQENLKRQGYTQDLKFYSPKMVRLYCRKLILDFRKKFSNRPPTEAIHPHDQAYIAKLHALFPSYNGDKQRRLFIATWISEEIFLHRFFTESDPDKVVTYFFTKIANFIKNPLQPNKSSLPPLENTPSTTPSPISQEIYEALSDLDGDEKIL